MNRRGVFGVIAGLCAAPTPTPLNSYAWWNGMGWSLGPELPKTYGTLTIDCPVLTIDKNSDVIVEPDDSEFPTMTLEIHDAAWDRE